MRLAARGETPAAFAGRCIPPGGVAHRSLMPNKLALRALPSGRLARLGATRAFHHGLLAPSTAPLPIVLACAAVLAAGHANGQTAATGQSPEAAARILAETRAAIGSGVPEMKTLVATGRTRQVRGDNLVPIEFEIQAELPDKFARRDEFPAQDAGPSVTGFNGDRFVQNPAPQPPPARPGGPPPPTPQQLEAAARQQLMTAKQDFARLMLGLFASSYSSYPLSFSYAGQAEAPQGRAEVLDVKGADDFAAAVHRRQDPSPDHAQLAGAAAAGPRPRSRRCAARCGGTSGRSAADGGEPALLRRVPGVFRTAAADAPAARRGRGNHGGNHVRSIPDQRAR